MACRATLEPMLMSEMRADITSETMTAGNGIFQRGETFVSQLWPGTPYENKSAILTRRIGPVTAQPDVCIMLH